VQNVVNGLILASLYLMFGLGLSLSWGSIGVLNFAHGAIFMFSAFVPYLVLRDARLPMIALLLVGGVVGAVLSLLLQLIAFEPIQRRNPDSHKAELQILVAGIGISFVLLAISQRNTQGAPFGLGSSSYRTEVFKGGGVSITNTGILTLVLTVALTAGVLVFLRFSRIGLALRGIGVDPEVASMMGVNRRTLARSTMAVSGGLAGIAGVLLTTYLGSIAPETGDSYMIKAFAVIILGGVGSTAGVALGSLVLAASETFILTQTAGTWVDAVSFGLIFIVLLLRPRGIFGRKEVRRT
jgi:branched-chain amino acid transport system permease protein